jgi:chromosome segregation ATPase
VLLYLLLLVEMGNRLLLKVRELSVEKEMSRQEKDQLLLIVQQLKQTRNDNDYLENDIIVLQSNLQSLQNEKRNLQERYEELKLEQRKTKILEEELKGDLLECKGLIQTYERSNNELKSKVDRLSDDNEYLKGSIQSSHQLFLDESALSK